jgi:hypothetical protein
MPLVVGARLGVGVGERDAAAGERDGVGVELRVGTGEAVELELGVRDAAADDVAVEVGAAAELVGDAEAAALDGDALLDGRGLAEREGVGLGVPVGALLGARLGEPLGVGTVTALAVAVEDAAEDAAAEGVVLGALLGALLLEAVAVLVAVGTVGALLGVALALTPAGVGAREGAAEREGLGVRDGVGVAKPKGSGMKPPRLPLFSGLPPGPHPLPLASGFLSTGPATSPVPVPAAAPVEGAGGTNPCSSRSESERGVPRRPLTPPPSIVARRSARSTASSSVSIASTKPSAAPSSAAGPAVARGRKPVVNRAVNSAPVRSPRLFMAMRKPERPRSARSLWRMIFSMFVAKMLRR